MELGPIHYSRRVRNRFDDPHGEYGVLYLAKDAFGAFAETFGQLLSNATGLPRTISSGELSSRALSVVACNKPLKLVDLTGPGLARMGADARLFAAEHCVAREWSRAIHEHPSKVDGLYYPSRHDPTCKCAAIFNEALDWVDLSRETWLSQGLILRDVLRRYGFALIESHLVTSPVRRGPSSAQGGLFP